MRTLALLPLLVACGGASARPPLPPDACRPADEGARPWESRARSGAERIFDVPVPESFAPRRGAARPRVLIQAFSDFECPFCARAAPTLERVLADYGECVQVVWRNLPMRYHRNADPAARAALEVHRQSGDETFWRYHDRLFAAQQNLTRDALIAHAEALSSAIDLAELRAVLDGDAHRAILERDLEAIDRIGPRLGTPTFFVNGALVIGAQPYEVFREAVEDALRDAYEARPD